jgi:hypothetical protein
MHKAVLYCLALCLYVSLCSVVEDNELSAEDEAKLPRFIQELRARRRLSVVTTASLEAATVVAPVDEFSGPMTTLESEITDSGTASTLTTAGSTTSVLSPLPDEITQSVISTYSSPDEIGSDLYRMLGDYLGYSWRAIVYNPLGIMLLTFAFAGT